MLRTKRVPVRPSARRRFAVLDALAVLLSALFLVLGILVFQAVQHPRPAPEPSPTPVPSVSTSPPVVVPSRS